jgi:dihydrofolate reductase
MRISAIVAMSDNRVIGNHGQLPWYLPADLKNFKKITMGYPIIMGRKTWQSINRPLPGRHNIIITRESAFQAEECTVVNSLTAALNAAAGSDEVFIIGGASIYEEMMPLMQRLYITLIHENFEGDTWFPAISMKEWQEIERVDHDKDQDNHSSYSFIVLERKK